MACLSLGILLLRKGHRGSILCRFPGCVFSVSTWYATKEHVYHERDHFHLPWNPLFHCVEEHCKFTSKRFPDLIRHFQVRHCKSPQKVSCPLPWCKYSGDKGFARKDKLTSHYKNVHKAGISGKGPSSKAPRAIRPVPASSSSNTTYAGVGESSTADLGWGWQRPMRLAYGMRKLLEMRATEGTWRETLFLLLDFSLLSLFN